MTIDWLQERVERPGITYWLGEHPSGLRICVVPRPGFRRFALALSVFAGSCEVELDGSALGATGNEGGSPAAARRFPFGTAHFLEHQFFLDESDGDISDRFAARSQALNAFTSSDMTTYALTGSRGLLEGAGELLSLMGRTRIDDDTVEHERSIIVQELLREWDDPGFALDHAMMHALFSRHPIREDILGTATSIGQITTADLLAFHRTAYRPDNAALAIIGDIDRDALEHAIEQPIATWASAVGANTPGQPRWQYPDEPGTVETARIADERLASLPILSLAIKLDAPADRGAAGAPPARSDADATAHTREESHDAQAEHARHQDQSATSAQGLQVVWRHIVASLFFECWLGQSSPLRERLDADGLIDDGFGAGISVGRNYAYAQIGGETPDPLALEARVRDDLAAWCKSPDTSALERHRRKAHGRLTAETDTFEHLADGMVGAMRLRVPPMSGFGVLQHISPDDIATFARDLNERLNDERSVVGVLTPTNGSGETAASDQDCATPA